MAALANLSRIALKAVAIVSMIEVVRLAGDTDYTSKHEQLRSDAATGLKGISILDDSGIALNDILIQTVLMWAGAYDGNNAFTTDVNALLLAGRDFLETPEETLTRTLLFLQWIASV